MMDSPLISKGDFLRQIPSMQGLSSRRIQRRSLSQRMHIDTPLLVLLLLLTLIGLAVLYSASGRELATVKKQAIFFAVGYVGMFAVAQIKLVTWQRVGVAFYVLSLMLLIAVMFFGVGAKGAQRWLDLPGLPQFQPSELMKIALPVILACYFNERPLPPRFKHIVCALCFIALPVVLIAQQPDLGTSLLISASGLVVLFLAGLSWWYIIGAIAVLLPAVFGMWQFVLHDYQRQRVLTLIDPEADKLGAGWNIIQSTTAIGSGGTSGKGYLSGTQSHLNFLPESHTDFIIAVLAEEFGLIGVIGLLIVYLMIIARGLWISATAQTTAGRLLGGSLTFIFFVYVFVNMGMVSGILPVVGVPLPLVSQGGTALVTLMIGFGILMAIATEEKRLIT